MSPPVKYTVSLLKKYLKPFIDKDLSVVGNSVNNLIHGSSDSSSRNFVIDGFSQHNPLRRE